MSISAPGRILHVIASPNGGAAEHLRQVVEGSRGSQVPSHVALPEDGGTLRVGDLESLGAEVHLVGSFHPLNLRSYHRLRSIIVNDDFDIVHCHGTRAAMLTRFALLGVEHRPKVLYTMHGYHVPHYENEWWKRSVLQVERWLDPMTDAVCCVSEQDRRRVLELKLYPRDKVHVIHNGVPLDRFEGIDDDPRDLRRELNIDGGDLVVCTVARLHPPKDFETLIGGFERAARTVPGSRLVIVGDGPLREEVEARVESSPFAERIHLLGLRRDVPRILAASDVFVLSSRWEGFPISVLEAMAAGVPVVATDLPATREIIQPKGTGFLVPSGDQHALGDALEELARDRHLREEVGARARERVGEEFSRRAMLSRLRGLYEELLSDPREGRNEGT